MTGEKRKWLAGKGEGKVRPHRSAPLITQYSVADIMVRRVLRADLTARATRGSPPGSFRCVGFWSASLTTQGLKQDEMDKFPALLDWLKRIEARPAVQAGIGAK